MDKNFLKSKRVTHELKPTRVNGTNRFLNNYYNGLKKLKEIKRKEKNET